MRIKTRQALRIGLLAACLGPAGAVQIAVAQAHRQPPRPAIAPLIAATYPNDADHDRIEDSLAQRARQVLTTRANALREQMVDVELIFKEPVTQKQIDAFLTLGGEITYLYRSVSFGWNGRLPLGKVMALPRTLGETLLLVDESKDMIPSMLEATSAARVRPIWAPGFAGSISGFQGSTNITIAILDSGVDDTHPDLAGRGVYVTNFTDEPVPASGDVGHGTAVAGIALGTGASSGSTNGTLEFTVAHTFSSSSANGGIVVDPMWLPGTLINITSQAQWNNGSPSTRLRWFERLPGTPWTSWAGVGSTVGTSPLTLSLGLTPVPTRFYTPGILQSNGITDFVITSQIANHPATADGFNKLRGVAPGCNWADARYVRSTGTGQVSFLNAAIDDLVARRIEKNIKLMNISGIVFGDPGKNLSLRQKVNSAVNNGIVMVTACGNDGLNTSSPGAREIDDPGRAALGISVAAANDVNQLTDYSSLGFDPSFDQGEDFKPDLMAPGGSLYYTLILAPDNNANDGVFPDQQANDYEPSRGTSRAAPFVTGCAALVIDAMEKQGIQWDFSSSRHPLFVKMLLCATATESGLSREGAGSYSPSLERDLAGPNGYPVGKDAYEGYGMINPDAGVEAVSLTYTNGATNSATFGENPSDRRCWARTMNLIGGQLFVAELTVPADGDFDLYLYSSQPSSNGTPVILASSAQWSYGGVETLSYAPETNCSAILVVKRVLGFGTFNFAGTQIPAPVLFAGPPDPVNFNFSFNSVSGRTYQVQYKVSLEHPDWQFLQTVSGDGTTKTITDPLSPTQRFYRVTMQ